MRRLASVFVPKRSGKSDVSSPESTVSNNNSTDGKKGLKRANTVKILPSITTTLVVAPSVAQLTPTGQSSGSSSSGSTSLPTPNDDAIPPALHKKSWITWLGTKKSKSDKGSTLEWDATRQEWRPHTNSSFRTPLSAGPRPPEDSEEDETSSESEDESEVHSANTSPASQIDAAVISRCRKNLYILTSNKIASPLSGPPLLRIPGSPTFPRSSNLSRFLPASQTLRITMHRQQVLRYLDGKISRPEELSIIPFGSRPTPTPALVERYDMQQNDIHLPDMKRISSFSYGLKRWASRTCFEGRMMVWTANDASEDVTSTHVSGTGLAVAELEFSEAMEVLAGLVTDLDVDVEPTKEVDLLSLVNADAAGESNHCFARWPVLMV
jgi:hypothetical protein